VSKSLFSTGIDDENIIKLGSAINRLQQHIVKEVRMPLTNWWRRLNGSTARAHKIAAEARSMLQVIIDDRKSSQEGYDDLLDMLIGAQYEDTKTGMTDQQILDEAIILFVAGYETTANTLGWCLHALREHPEVNERLDQEIGDMSGYTMEALMRPSYLMQVIEETMRMYPAAWILDRVALEDDKIHDVHISKGDLVGLYVFGTHRNPDVWTDALQYDPDRFAPSNKKEHQSYAFFPFGGGPRMCIGYHFANMEMQIAISEFFKRFKLPSPSGSEPDYLPLITLKPRENIMMRLEARS